MIGLTGSIARLTAVMATAGLDPVSQDPDDVRSTACDLVEARRVCHPPSIDPADPRPPKVPDAPAPSFLAGLVQLVLIAALVAGIVLLVVLIARSIKARRPRLDDDSDEVDDDVEVVGRAIVDRSREPLSWREEADRHAADGRYAEALRCRYRALVGDLARKDLLDEIPGRTTGEERLQLRDHAPLVAVPFSDAADLFDDVWYGDREAGRVELDRFVAWEYDCLDAATGRRAPVGSVS